MVNIVLLYATIVKAFTSFFRYPSSMSNNWQSQCMRIPTMVRLATLWLAVTLCAWTGSGAEVRIPVLDPTSTDLQPPVPVAEVSAPLSIPAGTLLQGISERALDPGRYRLRIELALTPTGNTTTAIRHYVLEAGESKRILNSLHFPENGRFQAFVLDFDVHTRQIVPVGVRWQPRPGNETVRAQNAHALQEAPPAPATSLQMNSDPFLQEMERDGRYRFMARSYRIESLSPVEPRIRTDKIVYRPGEQGQGHVELENLGTTAESLTLTVLLAHGLTDTRVLHTETIEIPARERVLRTVAFDTKDLYWGCELQARITSAPGQADQAVSVFCVVSNIWEAALIAGHGPDYGSTWKNPDMATDRVTAWRQSGFTGFELYFWPPCGFGDFTPQNEDFVSGQMQYRHSISGTRNLIAAAKEQGLSASLYSNLWCVDGYPGYELVRQHPEWFKSDFFDPSAMQQWRLAELDKIPAPRSWFRAEINQDPGITKAAMQHHASEIRATHEAFGWDAIRYDTYISSPWTIMATRLVRESVESKVPSFQFGYNSFPLADEAIGALQGMVDGGGMAMLEYIRFEQYASLAAILDELLAVREAVWRRGGHIGPLYRPPEPGTSAEPDAVWLTSIMLASGGHPYYAPLENSIGDHPTFALRYSEFLWNNHMRPLEDADARIAFGNGLQPLRWQQLARILDRGGRRRRMILHILNVDNQYRHFNNLDATPPPLLRDVPVTIQLPDTARIEGAWHLSAVPHAQHEPIPLTRTGTHLQARIPEIRFWSILVIDFTEAGTP